MQEIYFLNLIFKFLYCIRNAHEPRLSKTIKNETNYLNQLVYLRGNPIVSHDPSSQFYEKL